MQAFREPTFTSGSNFNRGHHFRGGHGSAAPSASEYNNQHVQQEYRQEDFRGRGGSHSATPHYSSRGPSDINSEYGQEYPPHGIYDRGSSLYGRGGAHSSSPQPPQSSDFDPKYQPTNTTSLYNRPPPIQPTPSAVPAKTDSSRGYLNANFQPNLTNQDDEPSYDDSKVKLDWCK